MPHIASWDMQCHTDLPPGFQEAKPWRRGVHQYPQRLFDVQKTVALFTEKLQELGCDEAVGGIAKTGVAAVINWARGPAAPLVCVATWMPCPWLCKSTCNTPPG